MGLGQSRRWWRRHKLGQFIQSHGSFVLYHIPNKIIDVKDRKIRKTKEGLWIHSANAGGHLWKLQETYFTQDEEKSVRGT